MQVSPARKTAFEILLRVEAGRGFAADLLQEPKISSLGEADRRLATELVLGVLRWRGEIDHLLEMLSGRTVNALDIEVVTALRLGLHQMTFLEKIPKSAAVNESVELTKMARKSSAAGLVNAVLRKFKPSHEKKWRTQRPAEDHDSVDTAQRLVPAWLLDRWKTNYGAAAAISLAWTSTRVPPLTLRVPSSMIDPTEAIRKLEKKGFAVRRGRFAPRAIVLESDDRIPQQLANEMHLAIQDEASQIVPELLAIHRGNRILDLCAAPGMKTAQMADVLETGLLVACDISSRRLATMSRLLPRLTGKAGRIAMVRIDASEPLPFRTPFERILVDAPCSGTGTLARNPEIKWRLTSQDLARLAETQVRLLRNALGMLAHGGRLVYATCSLEPEENEGVIEAALPAAPDCRRLGRAEAMRELPALDPLFDTEGYFHTRPDLHGMDGFFAAAIVRV